jgi:hypothetical protein
MELAFRQILSRLQGFSNLVLTAGMDLASSYMDVACGMELGFRKTSRLLQVCSSLVRIGITQMGCLLMDVVWGAESVSNKM